MSLEWIIYLANCTDNARSFLILISILTGFALLPLIIAYVSAYVEDNERLSKMFLKYTIRTGITFILSAIILVFLPDKTTVYTMVGASAVKEAIKTPEASKVLTLINLELDKQIDTLQKEKNHAN
jgi:hypothetical protein